MTVTTPPAPTLQLRDYQLQAVDYLQTRRRAALFLDMGLGKTAICLSALRPSMLPALVVAPKRVAESVWPDETTLWRPDLTVEVVQGDKNRRAGILEHSTADIVVIGRDVLRDAVPYAGRFKTFIMDEMSSFKSRNSIRWKAAKKIVQGKDYVWGLTGTPSPNGLLDLWAQVYLLDGGKRLGTGITAFRNRYFVAGRQLANGVITEWNLRPGADKRIHEKIEDICLSMETEGRVQLPPVTYNQVKVKLPPKAKKVYKSMKDDLVADLNDLGMTMKEIHTAENAAVLSSKLSQVAAGFMYVDDADIRGGAYTTFHNEKAKALQEIIEATDSPVLVFYRFRAELDALRKAFPEATALGDGGPEVIRNWNAGKIPVLLAHPASAGHGLNLQHGGHTVVWTSPTWSLEEYMQGNKRIARSGQKHPVVIHHLIAEGTVDTAVMARLQDKKSVQAALLDHLVSPL